MHSNYIQRSQLQEVPSISLGRTIANTLKFIRNPIPFLDQYGRELGETYTLHLGRGHKPMVTTNPALAQYVLQKNHRNYRKSHLQVDHLAHFIGNGLLTSNGAYWLQQRRLIQPGFHRGKLAALADVMLKEIDIFFDEMESETDGIQKIDIAQKMTELTFMIVAKSLFSTSLEKRKLIHLSEYFNQIQAFIARQIRQPFLVEWSRISGEKKKHEKIAGKLKKIILQVIQKRKQSAVQYNDLLDMLLAARYEDTGQGMTEKQLLEESLILFIAGHETSANALAWTWHLLSRHPEEVQKIRSEMNALLGNRIPSFEDLPKLTYLSWTLQESMRLYPPAWILDRVPIEEDHFEGITLPKNGIVGIYIYGIHHSPKYWPEPEKFDPTRFRKEEIKKRPPFAYLPFGGGPRLCIGANFAIMEMQLILARMIQRFDFEAVKDQKVETAPSITLRPKNGIMLRANKRSPL